jgi:hypothetical protein
MDIYSDIGHIGGLINCTPSIRRTWMCIFDLPFFTLMLQHGMPTYISNICLHTHFLYGIPQTSQRGITRFLLEVALFLLGTAIIYMILSFEPAFAEQDTINATLYSQLVGLQFIRAKKVLVCHLLLVVVEVYKWIVLAFSISSDFWLRWLVHEA